MAALGLRCLANLDPIRQTESLRSRAALMIKFFTHLEQKPVFFAIILT